MSTAASSFSSKARKLFVPATPIPSPSKKLVLKDLQEIVDEGTSIGLSQEWLDTLHTVILLINQDWK